MNKTIGNIETVIEIQNRLIKNKRVVYTRYGDGDLIAMYPSSVGKVIGGNNKSNITEKVRNGLIKGYNAKDESYLVGTVMGVNHPRSMGRNVNMSNLNSVKLTDHEKLYSAIAFQELFMEKPEEFVEFFNILNKGRYIFICQYHHENLDRYYGTLVKHIKTPKFNSPSVEEMITNEILTTDVDTYDHIIFSAGQASRIVIGNIWDKIDKNILDFGSVSDKLVFNTEIKNNIMLRGHIRNNQSLINNRLNYFEKEINK
jgi:hypothetical protein